MYDLLLEELSARQETVTGSLAYQKRQEEKAIDLVADTRAEIDHQTRLLNQIEAAFRALGADQPAEPACANPGPSPCPWHPSGGNHPRSEFVNQ